jgi:pimeloyl-ACP methyl ester carboxylesterase
MSQRQADEVRGLGRLLFHTFDRVTARVEEIHEAVARRSFGAAGPPAAPARVMHDAISAGVYATVRGVGGLVGHVADAGLALRPPRAGERPLSGTPGGSLAIAALNGAFGDYLEREGSELQVPMGLYRRNRLVAAERAALSRAFPHATRKLALFVHGLCETESAWRLQFGERDPGDTANYADRLSQDFGYTPLYLRYNTGRHISANGRDLARLLDDVVAEWPVEVDEIILVGHSMGGLVARSACYYGEQAQARWVEPVRHVFTLSSPHLGSWLEKAANVGACTLASIPETRAAATMLNARSAGIKDLRFGYLVDEDWCDCDPDARLEDRRCDIPFLETAAHYYIAATVSRDPGGLAGRVVGDLLVRMPSASGKHSGGRHIPFLIENGCHLGGLNHFSVLNHPAVYAQMKLWLERAAGAQASPAALPPASCPG